MSAPAGQAITSDVLPPPFFHGVATRRAAGRSRATLNWEPHPWVVIGMACT
ncbi:hypothetical protein [Sphingomonas sp. CL5.1]|uniref:hypothetical protein n=1 Tax=Sphingomonas sp. CL5.1 TaxID=2653203 RepID=UPI0020C5BFF2|nr:hypothetical protein [Sphingomonas sp. CL5.1]